MNEYLAHGAREILAGYFTLISGFSVSVVLRTYSCTRTRKNGMAWQERNGPRLRLVPWHRRPRNTTARTPLEKCAPILV